MCTNYFERDIIMSNKTISRVTKDRVIRTVIGCSTVLLTMQAPMASADEAALNTIDSFEKIFGVTKGKRRNHTKGFCFNGTLTLNDASILAYSNSELFTGQSEVIGRLSHKGGKSAPSDANIGQYGMSLAITTASNGINLMSMNTEDFFPVSTPEAFAELMRAKATSGDAVKAFAKNSPELQRYAAHMAKRPKVLKPYEGITFNSVNSFYLVDANNKKTAVRWSFIPSATQSINVEPSQDFFYENMQYSLDKGEVVWDMAITIANAGDVIDNAAIQWVGEHKKIIAAKLRVSSISTEEAGQCDDINYDPMVLSAGLEPSADPILQARRNIYAIGLSKRLTEKQHISKDEK